MILCGLPAFYSCGLSVTFVHVWIHILSKHLASFFYFFFYFSDPDNFGSSSSETNNQKKPQNKKSTNPPPLNPCYFDFLLFFQMQIVFS